MSLEKHSLVIEFSDHQHIIHHLKMYDMHFANMFEEYHDIDHQVFAITSVSFQCEL